MAPALRRLMGQKAAPRLFPARLAQAMKKVAALTFFTRVRLETRDHALWAVPMSRQGSGHLTLAGRRRGARHPPGRRGRGRRRHAGGAPAAQPRFERCGSRFESQPPGARPTAPVRDLRAWGWRAATRGAARWPRCGSGPGAPSACAARPGRMTLSQVEHGCDSRARVQLPHSFTVSSAAASSSFRRRSARSRWCVASSCSLSTCDSRDPSSGAVFTPSRMASSCLMSSSERSRSRRSVMSCSRSRSASV